MTTSEMTKINSKNNGNKEKKLAGLAPD